MSHSNNTPALASIIIPCWNQLEFTRHCIAALRQYTRDPWELIVIDNGSTDGTKEYLGGVQDMATVPVTIITNDRNVGFPAAINQGLKVARGEYLVLLNNDAVVTDAWLDQLIALANARTDVAEDCPIPPLAPPSEGGDVTPVVERGDDAARIPGRIAPTIGLVGPMSNYAAPPQLIERVPYANLDQMQDYARRWREHNRGKWLKVPKLSGFCVLMKRVVYETIGELDTRFGLGFFDDDDLAERARRAGFELAVALDLFVHHFGSRTFVGNGIDTARLLDENCHRFATKWGLAGINGKPVTLTPWPRNGKDRELQQNPKISPPITSDLRGSESAPPQAHPSTNGQQNENHLSESVSHLGASVCIRGENSPESYSDPRQSEQIPGDKNSAPLGVHHHSPSIRGDQKSKARVSLTMIVRNEENNLPHCLQSVAGVFDETVIVDTGSTDRTVEIAQSFGANVFHFPWIDDFAAARNAALDHATGDYAFWLDADDVVEAGERLKLEASIRGLKADDPVAFVVRCACDPSPGGDVGETVVDHIRLFPLRDDVRWTYRVHEQILPALNRAGIPVCWTDLIVRHTGYVDRELRKRKLARDARILEQERDARPDDPFVLFNLGAIAFEHREWPLALDYLRHSLSLSKPSDSITRKLFAMIARAHEAQGETAQALAACAAGLRICPDDAELLFREGGVRRHAGDRAGAERCWRRILGLRRPEQFASVDQGIYGHGTRRLLAALAADRGDIEECVNLWSAVLAERPGDREATEMLETLAARNRQESVSVACVG